MIKQFLQLVEAEQILDQIILTIIKLALNLHLSKYNNKYHLLKFNLLLNSIKSSAFYWVIRKYYQYVSFYQIWKLL
jgi:hypothetical protein